jgi:hypothetical protein
MHGWWWLRLQFRQWLNAWRISPVRSSFIPLCWLVLAIALPAALSLAGTQHAAAAMDWLLSFDMPLELLLAVQASFAIVALASRPDTESWISAPASRGTAGRLLFLARLLRALRWPLGLALAAALLSLGSPRAATHLVEVLLFAGFAVMGGASLAWLLLGRRVAGPGHAKTRRFSSSRGLPALSWVPLHETNRQLDPRRLALLGVPVLLLAPMGSAAQEVLRALGGWVVLLYISSWWRQAAQAARAMDQWMPRVGRRSSRLGWYIWRHVVLATLLGAAALWLGWRFSTVKPGITSP